MKKLIGICLNNFYFSIFYIITCFTFVTCIKDVPYINLLPKLALGWGIIISIYHIYKIIKRKPTMIEWFIISFLAITLMLNLIAYYSSENIKLWLINFVMLLSFAYIDNDKDSKRLNLELNIISITYAVITFITSSVSLYFHYSKVEKIIGDIVLNDTNGIFTNKNTIGIAAAISISIGIYILLVNKSKLLKAFSIINILLQGYTLYLSEARGPIIMVLALLLVLVIVFIKNKILQLILLICPALATIGVLFCDYETMYTYTTGRNGIWLSSLELCKNNYLIGVGNDGLIDKIKVAIPNLHLPDFNLGGTHNIYIQVLSANGPFALILLLGILFLTAFFLLSKFKNYENKKQLYAILAIVVGIALVNLYESNLIYMVSFVPVVFWTFVGYGLSLTNKKKRDD